MKLSEIENMASTLPKLGKSKSDFRSTAHQYKITCKDWDFVWYPVEYDPETRMFFGMIDGDGIKRGNFSLDTLSEWLPVMEKIHPVYFDAFEGTIMEVMQ
jgi:hypothetical protein